MGWVGQGSSLRSAPAPYRTAGAWEEQAGPDRAAWLQLLPTHMAPQYAVADFYRRWLHLPLFSPKAERTLTCHCSSVPARYSTAGGGGGAAASGARCEAAAAGQEVRWPQWRADGAGLELVLPPHSISFVAAGICAGGVSCALARRIAGLPTRRQDSPQVGMATSALCTRASPIQARLGG